MKLTITVKPNARHAIVTRIDAKNYRVAVQAPAHDGRANAAVIEALADFFDCPKSHITILHGHTGRLKVVEVPD